MQFRRLLKHQGSHRSWKVLGFEKCPGKSWDLLFYMKNPESIGILHYLSDELSVPSGLFELLPSYVKYSTSFFLVYLPVSKIKILEFTFSIIFFLHLIENA